MNFTVKKQYISRYTIVKGEGIILEKNDWDDYNYRTTFEVYYHNNSVPKHLGFINIAKITEDEKNSYDNIEKKFTSLNEEWVSKGNQNLYKNLFEKISFEKGKEVLNDLNDIMLDNELVHNLNERKISVITSSFFRNLSFKKEMEEVKYILNTGKRKLHKLDLVYYDDKDEKIASLNLFVDDEDSVYNNIHALIGKNGMGKTSVLRDLVSSLNNTGKTESHLKMNDINLKFQLESNEECSANISDYFNKVLYISFSAFDDKISQLNENDELLVFVGIEELGNIDSNRESSEKLKNKFERYIDKLFESKEKTDLFLDIYNDLNAFHTPISLEPFDGNIKTIEDYKKKFKKIYDISSAGQRIVLISAISLVIEIDELTLMIFDEPELYLHPPLLSNLMRSISKILKNKNGIGLVTTHSPVVIQELTKNCVNIIIRDEDDIISINKPSIETFGENVSTLTDIIFNLDIRKSGFYNLIDKLIKEDENSLNGVSLGTDALLFKTILLNKISKEDEHV